MKTALIISGGDYSSLPALIQFDICIACDKGYLYAEKMGIRPDIIIGDFDSASRPLYNNIPILTFPVEKDDTDTMLAIKYALEKRCEHIIVICALGNRLDHTLANIQSLAFIAAHNCVGEIISDTEHIQTLTGEASIVLPRRSSRSLSLFAVSDKCEGVSISGAKYDVADVTITNTFPIGCSNAWDKEEVTVSIKSGILLIVESFMS